MKLRSLRPVLIAATLGAVWLGGAPQTFASPLELQENSLQTRVDGFVAYLKSETNDAMTAAARAAREHQDVLVKAKAGIDGWVAELRRALSGRKASFATLGEDAAASLESLRQTAVSSWAKLQHDAADALDEIEAWMRRQFPSRDRFDIPV